MADDKLEAGTYDSKGGTAVGGTTGLDKQGK